jgi:hypothetical protein
MDKGSGFLVQVSRFRFPGSGFKVQGSGLRQYKIFGFLKLKPHMKLHLYNAKAK